MVMGAISGIEGRISPVRVISSRPGSFLVALVLRRRMHELSRTLDRAIADPRVHREVRRAAAHASQAARRARRVGPAQALGDRCVAREVHRARRHLTHAVGLASRPPRSHRWVRVAMVAAGMAAAGAAYAARRSERMQPQLVIEETDVVIATTVAP
jgi:hypothetical protein